MGLPLNSAIFRAYDIRGIVSIDLDAALYTRLGQAIGTLLRGRGKE